MDDAQGTDFSDGSYMKPQQLALSFDPLPRITSWDTLALQDEGKVIMWDAMTVMPMLSSAFMMFVATSKWEWDRLMQ
jgi:hypothetical protein